jgi:hypothetical protein
MFFIIIEGGVIDAAVDRRYRIFFAGGENDRQQYKREYFFYHNRMN